MYMYCPNLELFFFCFLSRQASSSPILESAISQSAVWNGLLV